MPTLAQRVASTRTQDAAWFINELHAISAGNLRALWLPTSGDKTTNVSALTGGRVWTYDATIAAQISALGNGVQVSFDGTSDQASTPDTADLTMTEANGLSIVALANVTDTAAARGIFLKGSLAGTAEYWLLINATDTIALNISIADRSQNPFRTSNAAITMGAFHLFGASYDGAGGATAANGMTLYEDAAVIASTATNAAGYTGMTDTATTGLLSTITGGGASRMQGAMGFVAVYNANLSAAQHGTIKHLANRFFGLSL